MFRDRLGCLVAHGATKARLHRQSDQRACSYRRILGIVSLALRDARFPLFWFLMFFNNLGNLVFAPQKLTPM